MGHVEFFFLLHARCITRGQHSRLVEVYLATGKTFDRLVHEAVEGYLDGFGTPNQSTVVGLLIVN